jgi:SAM-dependent methyltransferase
MTLRHGYFSDQGYTYGAYPETSPERLAFLALLHSQRPPDLAGPFQVLELGCGQGFGLCLQAACYPQAQFVGVDFSAEHIAHGRELARRAALANIHFLHSEFAGLTADPPAGWGAFDSVIAHGVLGWVSPEIGRTLIQLASDALRPGGLFYLSYNTLPGWLDRLPFQHAVKHFQQRLGDGQPSLDAALKLFQVLRNCNAPLFQSQPALANHLETLATQNPAYLLHEYNHAQWQPQFVDAVLRQAASNELTYLGSATLPESFLGLLPEPFRELVAAQPDPEQRELVRDLLTNQSFRRDVFAKGRDPLWPLRATQALDDLQLIALVDADDLQQSDLFSFRLGFGEVQGNPAWFLAVMEALLAGPCSVASLRSERWPLEEPTPLPELLQNLALLLHKGLIALVPPHQPDPQPAQRLNALIAADVAAGAPYSAVALPGTGNIRHLGDLELMLLDATLRGLSGEARIEALSESMATLQRVIRKDGKTLEGPDQQQQIRQIDERFERSTLPLLRRLHAIP